MEDESYRLIIDYYEKTISDDGLNRLREWIEESTDNLAQFGETIKILEASKAYFKNPIQPENAWAKISEHISQEHVPVLKSHKKKAWLAYAAACIIFCASGWIGYKAVFFGSSSQSEYEVISNADGKRSKVILPDSSAVYLGGGSTLRYLKKFTGSERVVTLNGEAFFDVVHNPRKAFVVKSGEISTVVLGTSFNVKAYHTDKTVTVTVNTGKVGVMADVNSKSRLVKYLLPNQQINIDTQSGLFTSSNANAVEVSAWVKNDLVFYNISFREIAQSLEHHYGVQIAFTDPQLGKIRLTAKLNNVSLHQALENLRLLAGVAYTQNGKHVFISNTNEKGGTIMK